MIIRAGRVVNGRAGRLMGGYGGGWREREVDVLYVRMSSLRNVHYTITMVQPYP